MYSIEKNFIPGLPQIPYQNGVGAFEGVVMHATANYGDSVDGERNWEASNFNDAFVHFFCDHNKVLQVADTDYVAWGAGQVANKKYVHIELCQVKNDGTQEAKDKFQAAYSNWIWIAAFTLYQRKLTVNDQTLWSHRRVTQELGGTTHMDPDDYLAEWGKTWANVKNDVLYIYNGYAQPTPAPTLAPAPVKTEALSQDNAQYIIDRWLSYGWEFASAEDQTRRRDLANALRRAAGVEEVK